MKAIVFERPGRAEEVLAVRDVAVPVPGPGQVLIMARARPVQPADLLFIEGRYRVKPVFPQVAGLEGMGTIVSCGEGVEHLRPGVQVAFRSPGAWAEFALAPVSRVYPVRPGVSDGVACQFALNPLTAWALLSECDLHASSTVLMTAGRSVVAGMMVKLALARGVRPILLVRSKADHGRRYALFEGRDGGVLAEQASVREVLQQGGLRYGAILDAVGGADTVALLEALAPGGRLMSYGILEEGAFSLKVSDLLFTNATWQGFGVDAWLNRVAPEVLAQAQQELWVLLRNEPDLLPVLDRVPLSAPLDALQALRRADRPGKVLLVN